ncbi:MAG: hypothetical protein ACI8XO_001730 [Verrucomicrobiales bacterium]|jgi:hypothetical protein
MQKVRLHHTHFEKSGKREAAFSREHGIGY